MNEPVTVTLEEAYREACLALGEALVRERLSTRVAAKAQHRDQGPVDPNVTELQQQGEE